MSNYRYELGGIIRDLECDIPYPTDEIVDLLEEKDQRIKELEEENQRLKQQAREEVVEEIRERLKKANFEIMSPIDLYSYTDNFLYQVEKGKSNVKD